MGQEFGSHFRVSHKAAFCWPEMRFHLKVQLGTNQLPNLNSSFGWAFSFLWDWGSQFLTTSWVKTILSSLPSEALLNDSLLYQQVQGNAIESLLTRQNSQSFDLIAEMVAHQPFSYSIAWSSPHLGRRFHQHMNTRRWDHLDHFRSLLTKFTNILPVYKVNTKREVNSHKS